MLNNFAQIMIHASDHQWNYDDRLKCNNHKLITDQNINNSGKQ